MIVSILSLIVRATALTIVRSGAAVNRPNGWFPRHPAGVARGSAAPYTRDLSASTSATYARVLASTAPRRTVSGPWK